MGWGLGRGALLRIFLKFLCKNSAFSCKIFTCFKMHPVSMERPPPHPLKPLLILVYRVNSWLDDAHEIWYAAVAAWNAGERAN